MRSTGRILNCTPLVEAATNGSYGYVAATDAGEELWSLSPTRSVWPRTWLSDIEPSWVHVGELTSRRRVVSVHLPFLTRVRRAFLLRQL
jgi:hypothetical protein